MSPSPRTRGLGKSIGPTTPIDMDGCYHCKHYDDLQNDLLKADREIGRLRAEIKRP